MIWSDKKIILTSTGLGKPEIDSYLKEQIKNIPGSRCAVVVTAHSEKENGRYNKIAFDQLKNIGFKDVFFFDFDSSDRKLLSNLDCLYVGGGDTFYLLYSIRENAYDQFIKDFIGQDKLYIGVSAGSCILGSDIQHLEQMNIDKNSIHLSPTLGLKIINRKIVPHCHKPDGAENGYLYIDDGDVFILSSKNVQNIVPLKDSSHNET